MNIVENPSLKPDEVSKVVLIENPSVKPEIEFIEILLQSISSGVLRVPKFQRPYYWNPSDMLSLFDSIYKGYPIGSLLLWESTGRVESLDEVGPIKIPFPETKPLTYILDGHQRLATLFGSLMLPADVSLGLNQKDWRWWIWFNLIEKKFVHVTNSRPEPYLFPLRCILKTVDFLEQSRLLQNRCPEKFNEFIAEAEDLAQRIKNYKVPITKIRGGILPEAVEIFSRLNTLGRKITADQMVSALTYREGEKGVDLSRRIDEIIEELSGFHFGSIKRTAVFRSIMAAANMDILASDWEVLAKKLGDNLPEVIDKTEAALVKACEFLYEYVGVPGDALLPYSHQMVMLSEFYHCCPNPDEYQLNILKKWFWATSFSGWFAGANSTQINNGVIEMREFARDSKTKFKVMSLDDEARPFPQSYDMRSARVRALLIFMFSLKPLDPSTHKTLVADQILREYGNYSLPYVFPRAPKKTLSNPANRILVNRVPGVSVKEQLTTIEDECLRDVLKSHAIPDDAYFALIGDEPVTFVDLRAKHLAKIEREFMLKLNIKVPPDIEAGETDIDTDEPSQE
jgi:hypothetical protein